MLPITSELYAFCIVTLKTEENVFILLFDIHGCFPFESVGFVPSKLEIPPEAYSDGENTFERCVELCSLVGSRYSEIEKNEYIFNDSFTFV